eukprot:TRINITY_DN2536_c1_g1_i1.p1 TRINITY_DN2536_c1_g1~~TRINITY_DN2536_c1_g1_i1.p1  ORF type:complete len:419 (-),score=63.31 TRINITY_DN2536_c1_g1_i1:164-1420(-)
MMQTQLNCLSYRKVNYNKKYLCLVRAVKQEVQTQQGKDVVMKFYTAYNARQFDDVMECIANDCVYHDLIYEYPFEGFQAIKEYFEKVARVVPDDLQFEVEYITQGDPYRVGVQWHTSIDGRFFPFSRGCSFYRVNDEGKIVSARDLVESASKPGVSTLKLLTFVAPIIREASKKVDFTKLDTLPTKSYAIWLFYVGYISIILLSTIVPGNDIFHTTPESLQRVLHESLNFWYVNIGLSNLGLTFVPSIAEHPMDEAIFNLIAAWGLLYLPFMLANPKAKKVKNIIPLWIGTEFITNIVFIPFLGLVFAPEKEEIKNKNDFLDISRWKFPEWSKIVGIVGLVVGVFSICWGVWGRPEYGDLTQRAEYMQNLFGSDRVAFAFALDLVLYSIWQAFILMPEAPVLNRFIPFFGMAAYLLTL